MIAEATRSTMIRDLRVVEDPHGQRGDWPKQSLNESVDIGRPEDYTITDHIE